MKEWKENLAQAVVEALEGDGVIQFPPVGETDRAVKFSDVAKAKGYSHVSRGDIRDIAIKVSKIAPNVKPVRVVDNPERIKPTESEWSTLYFTDLTFGES